MQRIHAPTRTRHRPWMALALALVATIACAGQVGAREVSREISRKVSVEQAVQRVQRETSGKVLSVQVVTMGKQKLYRIKVLTPDGQMRVVQVPAEE